MNGLNWLRYLFGTGRGTTIAQIAALNRVLAKMDALSSDSSQPKNRQ